MNFASLTFLCYAVSAEATVVVLVSLMSKQPPDDHLNTVFKYCASTLTFL